VELEPQDDFERELRQAFERRPAPPGLKRKIMARRQTPRAQHSFMTWQRMAASLVLTGVLAGAAAYRVREEHRKEEQAREQVFMALRITGRALNHVNSSLAAHGHGPQD